MKTLFYVLIFLSNILACTSTKSLQGNQEMEVRKRVEELISSFNNRDKESVMDIFHKDYQSLSPINKPKSISAFVYNNIENLEKNNFEIAIQIKEIKSGVSLAYVSMNWQLKTKGAPKEDDPFANVQRMDIWKLNATNKWQIFRTIIYNEKAF